jgi:hypothetical protein
MASLLNFVARALFVVAFLVLLVGLLFLGLVIGLVWWLVALITGRQRPQAKVWVNRFQQQAAEQMRRRGMAPGRASGEVIDAEVREIR